MAHATTCPTRMQVVVHEHDLLLGNISRHDPADFKVVLQLPMQPGRLIGPRIAFQGSGVYPSCDPWGKPFSRTYCKKRFELSGQRIAGPYVGCLDAILGDQDYIKTIMSPSRFLDTARFVKQPNVAFVLLPNLIIYMAFTARFICPPRVLHLLLCEGVGVHRRGPRAGQPSVHLFRKRCSSQNHVSRLFFATRDLPQGWLLPKTGFLTTLHHWQKSSASALGVAWRFKMRPRGV